MPWDGRRSRACAEAVGDDGSNCAMLIATVMPWHLATRAIDARMQRTPARSRTWIVVIASLYAFVSFAAIQVVYDWELDRKGLHRAGFHPGAVFRNTFEVHLVGFLVWWSISIVTAFLIQRFQGQLAAALQETRRQAAELQRLDRAKSDFVSMVAHEFRTPLTGIQGFSEILRDYDLSLEEIREYAGDINNDARRLTRMINAQLDLDRMTSGRVELHREPVDLDALVTDLVDHLAQLSPDHAIRLDLGGDLPAVDGDRDRLIQVASNLIANAVKYAPGGGVVTVATRNLGEAVELAVSDTGVGIAPDDLERVFQPYTRVEHPDVAHIGGTGLGLPIVRQIVGLHGGRVWAESVPGAGSTFRVRLPACPSLDQEIDDGGDRRLRGRSLDPEALPRGAPADAA